MTVPLPAPLLVFDRPAAKLYIMTLGGCTYWRACNNADSASRGPWPVGVFDAELLVPVGGIDGSPTGKYGSHFLRYIVPGRVGMGVHAGRRDDLDGAGRSGPDHATLGCIRTSDEAMAEIARVVAAAGGALPQLWVPR